MPRNKTPYSDRAIYETWLQCNKNCSEAARQLGIARDTVRTACQRVDQKSLRINGISRDEIEKNIDTSVLDGQQLKGTSVLYDGEGNIRAQWVKTNPDKDRQIELINKAISSLTQDIPCIDEIPAPKDDFNDELLTVIPMGDPHIGLYCWEEEVGESFNLDIAKKELCGAFKYLIDQSPKSRRCAIINLGDFFHADNMDGTTSRSGHSLDMASRTPDMIKVGMAAMRFCIEYAARKFETVEVVNAIGNHDDMLAVALSCMLSNVYENNPRIVIHDKATHRHYIRHGLCLIGVTHGHETKDAQLPLIMATERKEDWGQTKFRYFYRGHHHQDKVDDYNGCRVEQFRTLAPNDSYAYNHGYMSGKDMKMLVHHTRFGEVKREICSIELVRSLCTV